MLLSTIASILTSWRALSMTWIRSWHEATGGVDPAQTKLQTHQTDMHSQHRQSSWTAGVYLLMDARRVVTCLKRTSNCSLRSCTTRPDFFLSRETATIWVLQVELRGSFDATKANLTLKGTCATSLLRKSALSSMGTAQQQLMVVTGSVSGEK